MERILPRGGTSKSVLLGLGPGRDSGGWEARWLQAKEGVRQDGKKESGIALPHEGRKAGERGMEGWPGRCGVSPLERVAAHDSSGEGKTFPLARQWEA